MEKKIKAAQLKKRQAQALIKNIEQFKLNFTDSDVNEIPVCLEQLEQHNANFMDAISKLEELDESAESLETYLQERCEMDNVYRKIKGFLLQKQPCEANPLNASVLFANTSVGASGHSGPSLRLPKIGLPSFDGDSTKWLSFRDRFVSMIDSSAEIPTIMKLQYLLSSLKGEAALLFEHTTLIADNYASTWAAMLKTYDNPRMLVRQYLRKIHHLPAVKSESAEELAHLVVEFKRHVDGLEKLKEPVDSWDAPLTTLMFFKLHPSTMLAWEKHSSQAPRDKYKDLIEFLQSRVLILRSTRQFTEDIKANTAMVAGGEHKVGARPKTAVNAATTRHSTHGQSNGMQLPCPMGCEEVHNLRSCPEFLKGDVQHRREVVAKERLCFNCLNQNHQVRSLSMAAKAEQEMSFLETALLWVVDDHGIRHEARALLDSGSMCNFISESLAQKLLTTRSKVNVSIIGIGQAVQQVKGSIDAAVQSKSEQFSTTMEFLILKTPSAEIPITPIDTTSWKIPTVSLADPSFHIPGRIDIVIGSDAYWEMHTGRKRALGRGRPWLVETPFGWTVSGNSSHTSASSQRSCLTTVSQASLDTMLQRFWETESILEGPALSIEEDQCEKYYAATTTRDSQGRYVVSLPHKTDSKIVLGQSRAIADRRLVAVERRLLNNPEMEVEYKRFMSEYETLGHMRKLTEPVDDSAPHYYIPHHAVVKETSTTTKVRVVFDASCKTTSGYSLNDTLLVGPTVQDDLFTIILRFRKHAIALVADVEKMYRQVRHCESDHKLLRIRYRERFTDPIATYELQTVTYGTASAPFLATRTLQQIAHDHKGQYPKAIDPVLHDFYVDDLLTGAADLAEAIEVRKQISQMLDSAGFALKKWASNVPDALRDVSLEDLAIQSMHEWKDGQAVSTLGKLRRVMGYCLRFIECSRASKVSASKCNKPTSIKELENAVPSLTATELRIAELRLCQLAQRDSFAEELDDLKRGKRVGERSKLKWLSPYLDEEGMLRIGGRLGNANISKDVKHPIILAASHHLSSLLVSAYHLKLLHAGPQLMLATIRQRFWLIGGRNLARSVYHRCHTCFKNKPVLVKQAVADLPESRVTPTRPFAVSGVDYCGPFLLKSTIRNRSPTKAYIAIFVCFSTRAVHIELP
ncbi:uncharacterized protein LOC128302785 [Anopheles moucheti]|uniref:uncharacterized protein LOC128302785 n=1 Tax=Anopheles moucheti TaxID=186751 RepID=UPI0022F036CB|nr:uncharacterized protein LOC128302785 [Anopheles moucheti]